MSIQRNRADLQCRESKRTERLLNEKLKLTVLSLELVDSLLQLQALGPYALQHNSDRVESKYTNNKMHKNKNVIQGIYSGVFHELTGRVW